MRAQVGERVVFARHYTRSGTMYPQFQKLIGKTATITEVNHYGDRTIVWDDPTVRLQQMWPNWPFDAGEFFDPIEPVNEWEGELELL